MSEMKRVEQIKEFVSIEQGLNDLGYRVQHIDREQQFPCDLHGDGRDGKFSARVYPGRVRICYVLRETLLVSTLIFGMSPVGQSFIEEQ